MFEYPQHWLTRLHDPVPGDQVIAGTAGSYSAAVAAGLAAAVELSDQRAQLGEGDRALRAEVVVEHEMAVFIPGTRAPGHDQGQHRDRLVQDLCELHGYLRYGFHDFLELPTLGEDVVRIDADPTLGAVEQF